MSKLTALCLGLLVTLAVLAEHERRADLAKMYQWPVPPVVPAVVWPPPDVPPVVPEVPYIPREYYELDPVHVPFHADEMR